MTDEPLKPSRLGHEQAVGSYVDILAVGKAFGERITEDYPGTMPWRFTGGTIKRVAIDVSGEHYVDLEREAVAMMARE